jgi:uncharacterized repeat protein (TIGR03837 family)
MPQARLWDLFCRVIDNFGDAGVSWRLAADLASRGEQVRLWIDDPSPLDWMAPAGQPGVQVLHWTDPAPRLEPGDVVVETFGCDPPPAFVARMAAAALPPVWINLEHLSAEAYVERSHGLPSPQRNGLTKWFFFPGFTPRTGGLIREPGLLAAQAQVDRTAWLADLGAALRPGERVVLLFCYTNPALALLLQALSDQPTVLLVAPGFAREQLAPLDLPPTLRRFDLPWLDHGGFDRTLRSADLNIVRGEDSIVRALWAGRPFIWHIYPQHDDAHVRKLEAFLDRLCGGADPALAAALRATQRGYNGIGRFPARLPALPNWAALTAAFAAGLAAQDDLVTQLCRFVASKSALQPG